MPKTVVEKLVACLDEEIYKDHKMEIEAKKALDRQIAGFAEKESRLIVLFTEGSITQDLYTKKLTEYRQDKKKLEERLVLKNNRKINILQPQNTHFKLENLKYKDNLPEKNDFVNKVYKTWENI